MGRRYRNFVAYDQHYFARGACGTCCPACHAEKEHHHRPQPHGGGACTLPFCSLYASHCKPVCAGDTICLEPVCESHQKIVRCPDGTLTLCEGYYLLSLCFEETSCAGGCVAFMHNCKIFGGFVVHFGRGDSCVSCTKIIHICHPDTRLVLTNLSPHPICLPNVNVTVARIG